MQKKYVTAYSGWFGMRCVYMMTDENITANADKKILFGIMRQNMYMTEKKVYIEGAGQALFRDKRHIL